jgi:serine phosphatase RsbU (regulator of sigma subunit)
MKKSLVRFGKDYEAAFAEYLRSPGEQALHTAYELGRRAVADEVSLLEMSEVHHQTLVGVLDRNEGRVPVAELARQAAAFFSEALSTHEILQRGYVEAQRTAQLARRHATQLRRLADAALAMSSAPSVAAVYRIVATRSRQVIDANVAMVSVTIDDRWTQRIETVSHSKTHRRWAQFEGRTDVSPVYELVCKRNMPARGPGGPIGEARGGRAPSLPVPFGPHSRTDIARGNSAWLAAPLTGRDGRNIGVVQVLDKGGEEFTDNDEAVLVQLAQLASTELQNLRLYNEQTELAETLQRSLLPPRLPETAEFDVAALYRPGTVALEVAGDFYDFFRIDEHRWAAVIGDVCGKGPAAAALTGLTRHTIRAAAAGVGEPQAVVRLLNEAILRDQTNEFCTVAYATVRRIGPGAQASVVCGGHLPPVVLRADGRVEHVDCRGALLGVVDDPAPVLATAELHPSDALVFYTDGITEARMPREIFGERRLLDLLASCAGFDAATIVARVGEELDWLADESRRDDAAMLVVRVPPA